MATDPPIPQWLQSLPLAPEYRPTDTEFADPIAFISRIEREAAGFGICKVIPPIPKPSKKFVLSNLSRSFSKSPDLPSSSSSPSAPVFTTRHQELGSRKSRPSIHKQQVWQSGELYTLDQFEAKSKSFARSQLSSFKEVNPLLIESLFWKAAADKPIYIEYANDVPGSGFAAPEEPLRCRRQKGKRGLEPKCQLPEESNEERGTAGWKLSNSPWNLQVIARSPGSLTRFMPDEVPGVTSPMVYIGMLFSWFAWHVEDHELHSMNFLHMGSPKTWYAVPGEYAATLEEMVRVQGYGGNLDRLAAFTMLGEKTTLLSPEVLVDSGIPCCRLIQHPGEFVVTFPRAYHVGFSHGFNCGEAANFATPQWLKVAKEAAVRRAAMNYLPMLSHQQLLYMLTMSFVSRVPRALLSGVRSSRLKDRKREGREILVKKAFLNDMMTENNLLCILLSKEATSYAVLWEPDLLPSPSIISQSFSSLPPERGESVISDDQRSEMIKCKQKDEFPSENKTDDRLAENLIHEPMTSNMTSVPCHNIPSAETHKNAPHVECMISNVELLESLDSDDDDLPFGLNIDSGTLACVACGILGYPFMAIVRPSEAASKELFSVNCEDSHQNLRKSSCSSLRSCLPNTSYKSKSGTDSMGEQELPDSSCILSPVKSGHVSSSEVAAVRDDFMLLSNDVVESSNQFDEMNTKIGNSKCSSKNNNNFDPSDGLQPCDGLKDCGGIINMTDGDDEIDFSGTSSTSVQPSVEINRLLDESVKSSGDEADKKGTTSNGFTRPRLFCLQHALEVAELLQCKGGAHVFIICHSDYIKVKAYASSIAEEVGMQFSLKDVPLENASTSDLDLINVSVDDEGREEHGEDWTSKLGVNLRCYVNLRKQSASNHKQLTLALGKIFSDSPPRSAFSTLKWSSRRSRTPYKVVGASLAKPCTDATIENGKSVITNLNANSSTKIQVYQSRRREPVDMARRLCGHLREDIPKEFSSINSAEKTDCWDDHRSTSGHTDHLNEKVQADSFGGLFNVPISTAQNLQTHQESWMPLKVSTSVSNSEKFESCHPYVNVPVLASSEMHQEMLPTEEFGPKCEVGSSEKLESQVNNMELEVEQETRPADEANSEHEFVHTLCPSKESEDLQDSPMLSESNVECTVSHPFSSADQCPVLVLLHEDSEMQLEISVADQSNTDGIVDDPNSEMQPLNKSPSLDTLEMQQELPAPEQNNKQGDSEIQPTISAADKPNTDGIVDNANSEVQLVSKLSSGYTLGMQEADLPAPEQNSTQCEVGNAQLGSQRISSFPVVNGSELLQELHSTYATKANDQESVESHLGGLERCKGNLNGVNIKAYVRRRKRKREVEHISEVHESCNSFIRGPCEGLRPRTGQMMTSEKAGMRTVEAAAAMKVAARVIKRQGRDKRKELYKCDIEGCQMSFVTHGELHLHKLNRCTHKWCSKQFRSHLQATRHQRAHSDERPLKCPWRGCSMSFKWAWARTEHIRIHTGERPYKCSVAGCGLTFRFVSDFSRHRRKTGHYVNLTKQ